MPVTTFAGRARSTAGLEQLSNAEIRKRCGSCSPREPPSVGCAGSACGDRCFVARFAVRFAVRFIVTVGFGFAVRRIGIAGGLRVRRCGLVIIACGVCVAAARVVWRRVRRRECRMLCRVPRRKTSLRAGVKRSGTGHRTKSTWRGSIARWQVDFHFSDAIFCAQRFIDDHFCPACRSFWPLTERDPESDESLPYRLLTRLRRMRRQEKCRWWFLHGAGERGDDTFAQLNMVSLSFLSADDKRSAYPCFILSRSVRPVCAGSEVNWDAPQHQLPDSPSRPLRLLCGLSTGSRAIRGLIRRASICFGLSMGGFGVWDLLCRRPQLVAAAVIICGGGDEHQAAKMATFRSGCFTGRKTRWFQFLARATWYTRCKTGGQPRYIEYPMVAHDAWGPALREPELIPWLWRQTRTQ